MSAHITKAFSDDAHRHVHHITPSQEIYTHQAQRAHDNTTKVVPTGTTTFNAFRMTQEVQSENSLPGAFQGTMTMQEFQIPNNIHVIEKTVIEFVVRLTATAVGDLALLRPSYTLFDHISLVWEGSNESVILDGIQEYIHHIASLTDEEYERTRADHGLSSATDKRAGVSLGPAVNIGDVFTYTFRIPINGPLSSGRIFAAGVNTPLLVRVYFNDTSYSSLTGTAKPTLQSCQMLIHEAQVDAPTFQRLRAQYLSPSGVSIRYVERMASKHNYSVSNGQQISQVLTSHSSYAAGLLVYFTPQGASGDNEWKLIDVTDLQLYDSTNSRLTHKMDHRFLISQASANGDWPSQACKDTDLSYYYVPFALSLYSAYGGNATGGLKMDGKNRLDMTISPNQAAAANITMNVVSQNYAYCEIRNGTIRFHKS